MDKLWRKPSQKEARPPHLVILDTSNLYSKLKDNHFLKQDELYFTKSSRVLDEVNHHDMNVDTLLLLSVGTYSIDMLTEMINICKIKQQHPPTVLTGHDVNWEIPKSSLVWMNSDEITLRCKLNHVSTLLKDQIKELWKL